MSEPLELVVPAELAADPAAPRGVLDRAIAWTGDRVNPILVKEARQALKSRQFTITFFLVLIFAWGWSLLGPAVYGPAIRYVPHGQEMFVGYYVILAFPLLVIVPFGAFRSLANEQEDRTYELVSITTLNARQIIRGKLAGAALQMLIYLSAIAPCLAFTYLLRGIDLVTITVFLFVTVLVSLAFSNVGLLLGTLSTQRHWQVVISVAGIAGLLVAFFAAATMVSEFLFFSISLTGEFWQWLILWLLNYAGNFLLFFYAAAARLAFASDNRSTRLRIVMLLQHAILVGTVSWIWVGPSAGTSEDIVALLMLLGAHWYVLGALMTGESPELSLRVRRRFPQSALGRALCTWFNPGPGTGYVFATAGLLGGLAFVTMALWANRYLVAMGVKHWSPRSVGSWSIEFGMLGVSYAVFYLGLGLLLIRWLRRFTRVHFLLVALVHLLLVLAGACVPMVVQLSSADLRGLDYSYLQVSNPFWTLLYVLNHPTGLAGYPLLPAIVPGAAIIIFALNLRGVARELRQVRIAKPPRVEEEDQALAAALAPPAAVRRDPWDEETADEPG